MDSTMTDTMTGDLVQAWITVSGADGTTRLESRWVSAAAATADAVVHAA